MKILPNIVPAIKLIYALKYLNQHKKQIESGRAEGNLEKEQDGILKATDLWGNSVMRIFDVKLTVNGRENLPVSGPVVYVANHQGYGDIPACCAALNTIQFAFVSKDNLARVPLYGPWIMRIRSVFIKRGDARESLRAIDEGIKLINQGFSLLIFPEGTRSKGGPMGEFKKGSLRLATKPEVPIVPVTIDGTYNFFETKGYVQTGVPITITIHEPIPTAGLDRAAQTRLSEEVERIIKSALPSA